MRDEVINKRGYENNIAGNLLDLKISSYPKTAKYLAKRLSRRGNTICEFCCGVGVSLIEFSHHFDTVIGVDNDAAVIEASTKNLSYASVSNCELVLGNVSDADTFNRVAADIVAYDIPFWSDHGHDATNNNPKLNDIITLIRKNVTNNIVIYAPPHITFEEIARIENEFEYQEVWLDQKHDRNFIYLGNVIEKKGLTKITL